MIIMGILRGTPCYTGISYTFYGENICSVEKKCFGHKKLKKVEKTEIISTKFSLRCTLSLILGSDINSYRLIRISYIMIIVVNWEI